MKVGMFTREYPPEVYGGAGVHVTELTRFMRDIVDVDVHCMGAPRDEKDVYVHGVDPALEDANGAIKTLSTGLRMADAAGGLDVVHSHTWYAGLGGHLAAALLRRHGRHVVAQLRGQPPRLGQVAVQGVGLVLRQHRNAHVACVDEVGQDKIDQTVVAAERHGGLGTVSGQRKQALALTAGQDDGENSRLAFHDS